VEPDLRTKARIAALSEKLGAIHYANRLYWNQGRSQTVAAKAEYQFRQDRLEVIRRELAMLRQRKALTAEIAKQGRRDRGEKQATTCLVLAGARC
jgi:hypothetical protein